MAGAGTRTSTGRFGDTPGGVIDFIGLIRFQGVALYESLPSRGTLNLPLKSTTARFCYAFPMPVPSEPVHLSIICPAHNERDNLQTLMQEIVAAIEPVGVSYEIILVDDASTDGTSEMLRSLLTPYPMLRAIRLDHTSTGKGHGQSAAFGAGIRVARGAIIAMMDADLQNDPNDIPAMLTLMQQAGAHLVQGDRSASRADSAFRIFSSMVGRLFRRVLLGDKIRDTGCSLRLLRRDIALALPLHFRGMHRFIPITARRLGLTVIETPVRHRPRARGRTNYGVWNRAIPGLIDCLAVRWMFNRRRNIEGEEMK